MKKYFKKSLLPVAILTIIIMCAMFILPSGLFADTQTFDASPGANWNVQSSVPILFSFDLTGIDMSKIKSGKLKIWALDVEVSTNDVYFNGNIIGQLRLGTNGYLSEFDVPLIDFANNGNNQVSVHPDGEGIQVYQSELIISTGGGHGKAEAAEEPQPWVRDREMQCWQVWVNEDNAFEFVFVWEYANNNHVQIFDMAGNLVFETDMQKGSAHFVAELPDGMYTVKTFHEAGHILQEFVVGKP